MKFIITTIAIAAAFVPMMEGHLKMVNDGTYPGGDGLGPVVKENFPCTRDGGEPEKDGPTLTPGDSAKISLEGTAVHGGGSCQISITYDQPPTEKSVWKVMKSFIGGCPVDNDQNLNPGSTEKLPPLNYQIPRGLPSGKATIAW